MKDLTTEQNNFYGKGWSFPPAFSTLTEMPEMVSNEENIHQSLKTLIGTAQGERVMRPFFGCDLKAMMFREANLSLATEIEMIIESSITEFEPRVKLNRVEVDLDGLLDGRIVISVDYSVKESNSRYNLVYPYYLDEATLLNR
ncbi:MAG: GPW/gp25 family protein [Bacteroidia bacterium]|nr:GPW/gp25 family protein [Bacteroidia bacterium]